MVHGLQLSNQQVVHHCQGELLVIVLVVRQLATQEKKDVAGKIEATRSIAGSLHLSVVRTPSATVSI